MIKRMEFFNTEAVSLHIKGNEFDKHVIYADDHLYCQCTGNLYMRYNSYGTDDNVACIDFNEETKQYIIYSAEKNKYFLKAALLGVKRFEEHFDDMKEASEFLNILSELLEDTDCCYENLPEDFEFALNEYYEELSDAGYHYEPKKCKIYSAENVILEYKLKNHSR